MSKNVPSGYEKCMEKMEEQHKLSKLHKISCFLNTAPRENNKEVIIDSNTEINIEPNVLRRTQYY